jgi:hypothetical protein
MIRAKRNVLQLGRPSLQEERDNESILRELWGYPGRAAKMVLRSRLRQPIQRFGDGTPLSDITRGRVGRHQRRDMQCLVPVQMKSLSHCYTRGSWLRLVILLSCV